MRISAGRLNQRVTLLQPVTTLDALAGPVVSLVPVGDRWCAKLRFAAAEIERDASRATNASVRLALRLDGLTSAITTEWRMLFEGEEMVIAGVERATEDGSVIVTGTLPEGGEP